MRHVLAALLHLIVFGIILAVYLNSTGDFSFLEQGWYSMHAGEDEPTLEKDVQPSHTVFVMLLVLFPLITACFHIRRHFGTPDESAFWRFVEYACTSTMMIYNLAILCGVLSTNEMISILVCNACVMLLGYVIHLHMQAGNFRGAWIATGIAWSLLALVFLPIRRAFYDRVNASRDSDVEGRPGKSFFDAVFWSMVTFFCVFGLVQLAELFAQQFTSTNPEKVRNIADISYDVLSFSAKTTLVGLVAGGLFGRANAEPESEKTRVAKYLT